jgi:hypothetical protein
MQEKTQKKEKRIKRNADMKKSVKKKGSSNFANAYTALWMTADKNAVAK